MEQLLEEEITRRKLEVFSSFMKNETIGRTAEVLKMSNVSIHRSLHSLEEGIGCPLFTRKGRNLLPLPTAKELYAHIDRVLADLHSCIRSTRLLGNVGNDHVRLGTLYSLAIQTLPQLITGLRLRRPHIDFELHMGSNKLLLNKLSESQLDAIIIATGKEVIDRTRFEVLPLFTDRIYLTAPMDADFPTGMSATAPVDLRLFKGKPFVSLSEGFATYRDFQSAFRVAGFEPNIVAKVKDIFSVLSMVQSGLGFALLPRRMCAVYKGSVRFLPLAECFQQNQSIGIVFDRSREYEPNLLALVAEGRMFARHLPSLNFPAVSDSHSVE